MKLDEIKETPSWDPEKYRKELQENAKYWPLKETMKTFVDLDGRTRHIGNKPYCLVDYDNNRMYRSEFAVDVNEKYKRDKPKNWQIIDLNNNRVLADPYKKGDK